MKNKKIILIFIFVCLLITGCQENENKLEAIIRENEYIIVDVRTKEEYDESHIVDSINIPYDEIDSNVNLNKDKLIMVYCKSGKRSGIAYNTLKNLGYDVYDMGAYDDIDLEKVSE